MYHILPCNYMSTDEFTVDSVPHAPPTIVCKKDAWLYLLLDPDTPNWVIVDDVGKDIIELCNGKTSMKEIIEVLCKKYGEPYEESIEGVLTFANQLRAQQFLQKEEFPPPHGTDRAHMPFKNLWLNVTNQCNLQCIHCILDSGAPLENELTIEEIYQVISDAAELKVERLVITGGEPLLRKDILKILEYACAHVPDVKAGANPQVSMTMMKKNMNEVSEMVTLVKKLGIKRLHFPILYMKGRAKENESEVALSDKDTVAFIKKTIEISKTEDIKVTVEKYFQNKIVAMHKIDLCAAGVATVNVSADGKVYPCFGFHDAEFCAGSIREQSLKDIWNKSEVLNKFRSFSVLKLPKCQNCELKFICGGGCFVDRYYTCKRLDAPEPRCTILQEVYWYLLFEMVKEVQQNFQKF